MKFAYADPPYLGCAGLYREHPDWKECDTVAWHARLLRTLTEEYPDGWALSMASTNLKDLLPYVPDGARVAAWVKPFAVFKPHVNPAYTWEPVVFMGGRKGTRTRHTVKDHLACSITLRKGLTGAKPEAFCRWILELLGYETGDILVDMFPGTGIMGKVISAVRMTQLELILDTHE